MKKVLLFLCCLWLASCQPGSFMSSDGLQSNDYFSQDSGRFPYENSDILHTAFLDNNDLTAESGKMNLKLRLGEGQQFSIPFGLDIDFEKRKQMNISLGIENVSSGDKDIFLDYTRDPTSEGGIQSRLAAEIQKLNDKMLLNRFDSFSSSSNKITFHSALRTSKMQGSPYFSAHIADKYSSRGILPHHITLDISEITDKIADAGENDRFEFGVKFPYFDTIDDVDGLRERMDFINSQPFEKQASKEIDLERALLYEKAEEQKRKYLKWRDSQKVFVTFRDGKRREISSETTISNPIQNFGDGIEIFGKETLAQITKIEIIFDPVPFVQKDNFEPDVITPAENPFIKTDTELGKQGIEYREVKDFSIPKIVTEDDALILSANITSDQNARIVEYKSRVNRFGVGNDITLDREAWVNFFFAFSRQKQKTHLANAYSYVNIDHAFPLGRIRHVSYGGQEALAKYQILMQKVSNWYHAQFRIEKIVDGPYSEMGWSDDGQIIKSILQKPLKRIVFDISGLKPHVSSVNQSFSPSPFYFTAENFFPDVYPHYKVLLVDGNGNKKELTNEALVNTRQVYQDDHLGEQFHKDGFEVTILFNDVKNLQNIEQIEVVFEK